MITQMIFDWLAASAAGAIDLLPVVPPEFSAALTQLELAGWRLGNYASALGPIVPWGTISVGVAWIIALLVFWLALVPIKIVFWLVGR